MNGTNSSAKHYDRALPDITTPYKPPNSAKRLRFPSLKFPLFCEEWSFSTAQARIPVE